MSTSTMITVLAAAIQRVQQAKTQLLSDYSYAQHQTEDRLFGLKSRFSK